MQMMSRYIVVLCAFLLVWMPTAAYAGDVVPPPPRTDLSSIQLGKVSQLRLGQRAPFAGVLLSDTAAAKLFGELKFTEQECKLRIARELNINTIQLTSQIKALELRLDVENKRTQTLIALRDDRIKFLEKNFTPPAWYETGEFWFAVGILSGVAITAVSAYALGQAAK